MFTWPEGTESRHGCGEHCKRPAPGKLTAVTDVKIGDHCPCRECHNAIHHSRSGDDYVWFAGGWAIVVRPDMPPTAEDITRDLKSEFIRLGYSRVRHVRYRATGPVKEILARYSESGMAECEHVASLDIPPGLSKVTRPEAVLWAAWKPGTLVCYDCRGKLTISDNTENHRCDGCGKVSEYLTTGTSVIDPEMPGNPPLICVYGLCATCARASGLR